MSQTLADSIRFCQSLAQRTGKNFYWSFLTLPRQMRQDMCVLYAFMRFTDDIGDNADVPPESRRRQLSLWRSMLTGVTGEPRTLPVEPTGAAALADSNGDSTGFDRIHPQAACVLNATAELVERRGIPTQLLHHVIAGVETDLSDRVFPGFAELEQYCYQVAGAVGLCCIHIWGFQGEETRQHAIDCGTAFQLTNILRDLGEDARNGRVYLPQEDLQRFGVSADDLRAGRMTDALQSLLRFERRRAWDYYARSARIIPCLSRPGQRVNAAMFGIYGGLLREIDRRDGNVFAQRVSLSRREKLTAAFKGWLQPQAVADALANGSSGGDG